MIAIPDPGRASKAVEMIVASASPFDGIRIETLEGREYWSARDLMELLGYSQWRDFANAITRARAAAHNSGHETTQHFAQARKVAASGPAAEDFHLSRFGAYLVAMNADPHKARVAEAQTYFTIRTREAEVAQPATPAIPQTYAEALRAAADQAERAERAESQVRELSSSVVALSGPASSWNELAEAHGDYSVADAAKVLSRSDGIDTGERRLFKQMQGLGWVYRRDGHWSAYQAQLDTGRLVEKVTRPFERNGEMFAPAPTIRVTPKGLAALHKSLGGGGEQLALASVE